MEPISASEGTAIQRDEKGFAAMTTMTRRSLVRGAAAILAAPAALRATSAWAAGADARIGQLLMLGFYGDAPDARSAKALAAHMKAGRVGGAVFLRHNVASRQGVEALTAMFHGTGTRPLLSIDQEGGKVQRLGEKHGYTDIPEAGRVSARYSPNEARALYARAGEELRRSGFNVNLAPAIDLHDPDNPVIGRYERAYGTDPKTVAIYGQAFIDGFSRAGVSCVAKHFPGHGTSRGDSHDGFVNITRTWRDAELEPFRALAATAPMVMGGHLVHDGLTGSTPVTFSKELLEGTLRGRLGFTGAIMTDDLDMGAIRQNYSVRDAVVRSVAAGNDIVLMSNSAEPDSDLAAKAVAWIKQAVGDGEIAPGRVDEAHARVMRIKEQVAL